VDNLEKNILLLIFTSKAPDLGDIKFPLMIASGIISLINFDTRSNSGS
tara:strand:- start:206 stop:349 length:144 start_codon:yes stop_codon:yes gene_type:complete